MLTESNCSSLMGSAGELAEVNNANKQVVLSWRNLNVTVPKKLPKKRWFEKSVSVDSVILNNGKQSYFVTVKSFRIVA